MLQPPLKVRIFQKYAIGKSSYRQNMSLLQKKYACFTFKACKITLQIEEIEFFTFSSDIYVSQLMLQSLFIYFLPSSLVQFCSGVLLLVLHVLKANGIQTDLQRFTVSQLIHFVNVLLVCQSFNIVNITKTHSC